MTSSGAEAWYDRAHHAGPPGRRARGAGGDRPRAVGHAHRPARHAPVHRQRGDVLRRPVRHLLQRAGRGAGRHVGAARGRARARHRAGRRPDRHPPVVQLHDAVRGVGHPTRRHRQAADVDGHHARAGRPVPAWPAVRLQRPGLRDRRRRVRHHVLHADRLPRGPRVRWHGRPDHHPGALRGQFSGRNHVAVEAVSMYWHFVDVVWICVFSTIYLLR
jgi:hypothetical protein